MISSLLFALLLTQAAPPPVESAELARARAEINLERRSEMALVFADDALAEARKAYRDANMPRYTSAMKELRESIDLAREALREKRRSAKYFKRAEQRTRVMTRRLEDFAKEAAIDDRPEIEAVLKTVDQAHTEFLNGVLRK